MSWTCFRVWDITLDNTIMLRLYWTTLSSYYNSRLSNKPKEESCIGFIQENSIEFLVQHIYCYKTRVWTDLGLGLGLGP